jgi:hypothetical protein
VMDEAALGEVQAALPRRLPNPEAPRAEGPLPLSKAGRRRVESSRGAVAVGRAYSVDSRFPMRVSH